ncbi:MAG: hypothetical protein QM638_05455 [Nocardioides sp.]|uniref:hypothetical protein n=1 Tax=Nocardioides sp. TaxID=35761 RepID=UPI0039E41EFE
MTTTLAPAAPTSVAHRIRIAIPISVLFALVGGALAVLIGRFLLGLPGGAAVNVAGHALSGAVAGFVAGLGSIRLYERGAGRRRTNPDAHAQALTSGVIGAVIDAVMSALINGIAIGVPATLATQTSNHVVTGVISGLIAAFIGLMVHQHKTARLR